MNLRTCIASVFALVATSAFASPSYDHIYAFGDSYSDNGAGEAFTKSLVLKKIKDAQEIPGSLYWKGRWSNGPTAVENLANLLKVPLTDYAIGGAKSGNGNYYSWMGPSRNTGVFGQTSDYLKNSKAHKADPKSLYFLFISANDFLNGQTFHTQNRSTL